MESNLEIYDTVRRVPAAAQKTIADGRLRGKTDINPMWRIKVLTEKFGPAGIGWYYTIDDKWLEHGNDGIISAFVQISLYIKIDNEWSKPIIGVGGNMFVAQETKGLHTSDECYKMALTDAISVSCKALGLGADVYWDSDRSKYDTASPDLPSKRATPEQLDKIKNYYGDKINKLLERRKIKSIDDITETMANDIITLFTHYEQNIKNNQANAAP